MAFWIPNKRNLKEKSDYGVRVARPGFDANTCAQNQLLFNSSWPIMQIAEVIDMRDEISEYKYIFTTRTLVIDEITGDTISDETVSNEVAEPPSGYNNSYTETPTFWDERRSISVNKKYVYRKPNLPTTTYYYPSEAVTVDNVTTMTTRTCVYSATIPKKKHHLGFVPFFMMSDWVSNIKGYVILFSIDIRKDIDYPYVDAPLPFLSPVRDYGIKSSSKFSSRVPGLCSNMFSKLVQCVKTEESNRGDRENQGFIDTRVIWSPVQTDDPSDVPDGVFYNYEMYSFIQAPFVDKDDGGEYFEMSYVVFIPKSLTETVDESWEVTTTSFQSYYNGKNSLVVLRKPMVSPEYEEIII